MSTMPPARDEPVAGPVKRSEMASTSLLLGILGVFTFGITSLVGIAVGAVSLARIADNPGLRGERTALVGITVSTVTLLLWVGMILPLMVDETTSCDSHRNFLARGYREAELSSVALKAQLYACRHEGKLPPADDWLNAIDASGNSGWVGGPVYSSRAVPIAMNIHLAAKTLDEINNPDRTVLFFEARTAGPLAGGPELLPTTFRRDATCLIAFVDGHVEDVGEYTARKLVVWDPREARDSPVVLETRPPE